MAVAFVFGAPELRAVMLATAIIATIAALRYHPWAARRAPEPDGRDSVREGVPSAGSRD